jgi:N-6 DNA methylase
MATRSAKIDQKADLIWAIADKLTGVYKPHEYGDVILPLKEKHCSCLVRRMRKESTDLSIFIL